MDSHASHYSQEHPASHGTAGTTLPSWLVPGLAVALVAVALVIVGVLPASLLLYGGLFGGMIFMHAGGHGGHGGHAGHGMEMSQSDAEAGRDQPGRGTSEDAAPSAQHRSHGCH